MGRMRDTGRSIANWLDERLHFTKLYNSTAGHTIPSTSASWWYVLGSATLVCFVIQVLTGICLALVYVPSPAQAYESLEYLNYTQPFGWFLRALHSWSSNFMVGLITLHMIQVFLFGAYKYPRELTWIVGCVLFLCTIAMAFTGQVLRFDQDAYWALQIVMSVLGRVPLVGADLLHLIQGGPIVASETLSRFFTLHVFVVPGLIIALLLCFTAMPGLLQGLLITATGAGLVLDLAAWWLARDNAGWVIAIVIGGTAYSVGIVLMTLAVFAELWRPGGEA